MPDGYDAAEDERVLAALRGDGGPGPMPRAMRDSVRAAFRNRRADSVFADVREDDGATDTAEAASGLRAGTFTPGSPRYVRLGAADVEIHLEITALHGQRDIVGQVLPADATTAEVRCPHHTTRHEIDSSGAFVARGIPKGPVSVLIQRTGASPITTRWITT